LFYELEIYTSRVRLNFSNNMSEQAVLIIFVKNPELGKVKTRLAKDTGDEMALKI